MNFWPFQPSRAARDASLLLERVVSASRDPALFGEGRTADTLEGRFEVLALFATLALARLRADQSGGALAQEFTDRLFRSVDSGLREAGVGDLAVPKRMHRLAGEFYGRANAYAAALQAGDQDALVAALERNIGALDREFAVDLAGQILRLQSQQAAAPLDLLLTAEGWRGVRE